VSLGLSIETLGTLENIGQTQSQPLDQRRAATLVTIAHRIADDLYSFMCSYAKTYSNDPSDPNSEETVYMPMRWANIWRERIGKKIDKDSAFWSSQ
jgi:hypothetical protein